MPRVKRGTIHKKKKRTLLKAVKGYKWGRKNKIKLARPAMLKAGVYAYRDRRNKKRDRRALWQIQISAACKERGTSYSKVMGLLKKQQIEIDRKILSGLAQTHPTLFDAILAKAGATTAK